MQPAQNMLAAGGNIALSLENFACIYIYMCVNAGSHPIHHFALLVVFRVVCFHRRDDSALQAAAAAYAAF